MNHGEREAEAQRIATMVLAGVEFMQVWVSLESTNATEEDAEEILFLVQRAEVTV